MSVVNNNWQIFFDGMKADIKSIINIHGTDLLNKALFSKLSISRLLLT